METKTRTLEMWSGEFGELYTKRNNLTLSDIDDIHRDNVGISRTELNKEFVFDLDRSCTILEVGSNVGSQLCFLENEGFCNLFGIEINEYALKECRKDHPRINCVYGSALDIPFKDGFFDLVFTSGVLIHIDPRDLDQAMREICRCSNKYVWGYEYFSDQCEEVSYRRCDSLLWRNDYAAKYIERCGLKLLKQRKLKHTDEDLTDTMFLLEK